MRTRWTSRRVADRSRPGHDVLVILLTSYCRFDLTKLGRRHPAQRRVSLPFPCQYQSVVDLPVAAETLFTYLDDHGWLGAHVATRSWQRAALRMVYTFDANQGRAIGSRFRMRGQLCGMPLRADLMVVAREPPRRKAWETTGATRLLLVDGYCMGFEIEPIGAAASRLNIFIVYVTLSGPWRWLSNYYARWCTERMTQDVLRQFQPSRT